jgi:hypothetical protein
MRIDEITKQDAGRMVRGATLGPASWVGGVVGQLGRKAFQKFTGIDPDTGETSDLYSLLMQQPRLLYHPRTQALLKKGLLSKEQLDNITVRANEMGKKTTPDTSSSAPAAPGSPPPEGSTSPESGPKIIDPATGKPFTTEARRRQRGISA